MDTNGICRHFIHTLFDLGHLKKETCKKLDKNSLKNTLAYALKVVKIRDGLVKKLRGTPECWVLVGFVFLPTTVAICDPGLVTWLQQLNFQTEPNGIGTLQFKF